MHSQPEEFINYDLLTAHTGRAPVYAANSAHRRRRTQLARTVHGPGESSTPCSG